MKLVPQKDWTLFSHWLIWHGRRRCDARKPDCANCEIQNSLSANRRQRNELAVCSIPANATRRSTWRWTRRCSKTCRGFGKPVLRFYGWTEPAATFGYFQKFSEVERATPLRPLIRRPTGGGIVPHDADWTYSAAFPPGHEWHSLKAEESYRRIHDWLRLAFAELKIETGTRARTAKKTAPGGSVSSATKNSICSGTAKKLPARRSGGTSSVC